MKRPTAKWRKLPARVSRFTSPRRGKLILVVGGASSGKSVAALDLAGRGFPKKMPRAFVATGQPLDEEMADRIRLHQASRGAEWTTEEVPVDLAAWFEKYGGTYRIVVLDCLTLWLSNLQGLGLSNRHIADEMSALLRAIKETRARVVIVSNELGLGLVPLEASVRQFRDLAGKVNQLVALEADEVYFVVSGLPVRLKE